MSDKSRAKWEENSNDLKKQGFTAKSYEKAYAIAWDNTSGTNENSRIGRLQKECGLSYENAKAFYKLARKKEKK
jgi:hypothetical protein